jgi:hypothetical protein
MDEYYVDVENDDENFLIYNNNTQKRKPKREDYVEFEHFETDEDWLNWMAQQDDM